MQCVKLSMFMGLVTSLIYTIFVLLGGVSGFVFILGMRSND